ncbi:hypothetical protein OCO_27570 [Mycobacterium intracellulare MOTT-02]|uniref:Uncharacterized protein n=2 Tax=Mycobacterium intracellulare TaxID=1767 RepID=X8CT94_MYCIT|nr:hypothetical protein OCU_27440 [Mycobacterium intracellulare ATCC 13950]AFC49120.1 hypothetical protein OCO_27570 [Mycobacterium intracellulare MOTT-02]ASW85861.1 hypothetical protein CKJ61_13720 [Mycobacterium intracellulare]ETZ35589.1 hypothetical protein L843_3018 [Mycobacterium intracellulare MIN_061107_1834]EUA59627.1 hypothetical protein I550_2775 [Mycobacterium intracellulare 1956]
MYPLVPGLESMTLGSCLLGKAKWAHRPLAGSSPGRSCGDNQPQRFCVRAPTPGRPGARAAAAGGYLREYRVSTRQGGTIRGVAAARKPPPRDKKSGRR